MKHAIETFFAKLRRAFVSHPAGGGHAILGGLDEPGLRPLTRGETTHLFMNADGSYDTVALFRVSPRTMRRTRDRILCNRQELNN